ncbi:zinc finger-containing ubiquitin peptidase 1 isoform X1 [Stegostoma tigrinum]|uniref:zinc finger-containing ubiquitin peptidase 1 isoform X1 n=2 Tax=Stegostoma tigrinum TaxID=3053191 RepID=UPI00202B4862|nr:zinc finger-containing ubiquitin peptidase 1 isoform X1 [Stegostoma tigrinum]XP_048387044.1 zinc finger-containing ubiquitin peptidase 1 isoform X1 [Stegostoma tigrinum]XP_048387045.1 zinc finger-containing ubiquitin peptidase 1 isoform X1 [Stegostoma tigrinum]XP_048387046.1 zinc finger-containing ubiquitin peptidase 1 isoform X1 [Stegostoma tigrinum]XP_048387047.1 zinc finger-containing ubiquitin peptidase 1 isoform X1 [Stegostoma tigrinum]XP_048387048.1 zinc finger-containing ubiquitin pe
MFTCDICGQGGLSEPDMRTHILIMHEENEYSCPMCNLSGISYNELMFHIETSHGEVKPVDDNRTMYSVEQEGVLDSSLQTSRLTDLKHKTTLEPQEFGGYRMEKPKPEQLQMSRSASPSNCERTFRQSIKTKSEPKKLIQSESVNGHFSGTVWRQPQQTLFDKNRRETESNGLRSTTDESMKFNIPECPFCGLIGNAGEDLSEHVKSKHAEILETPQKGCGKQRLYPCPMCKLVFVSCQILQEHVELHLAESRAEECALADHRLAQKLQEDEEMQRKAIETKRERDDFQKLQRQYGLDNRGGYKQQIMRNMERAVAQGQMNPAEYHCRRAEVMETLALGEDDGRTRTSGLIKMLNQYYQKNGAEIRHVILCAETDHYHASLGDKGWGCGYRNFQMLLSSLIRMEEYTHDLHDIAIPCIPKIQSMIEEAWKDGFDPQGAAHFKNKLQGTRAWIGATEIYSLLTFLRIKCQIVDFHSPTGPSDTHPRLFEWIWQFYSSGRDAGLWLQSKVMWTSKPPIYLQHQGHSRTIIGIEERKNGTLCLLIFDPGNQEMQKLLHHDVTAVNLRMFRRFLGSMKHKQYQIVAVNGRLTVEEKNARKHASAVLTAEKVP